MSLKALAERTRIFISTQPVNATRSSDFELAEFQALDWLQIEGLAFLDRIGDAGDSLSRKVTAFPFDRAITTKRGRSAISTELRFDLAPWRPGQAALLAAEAGSESWGFRIRLADAPRGGTPSERYFAAAVGSAFEMFGGPNDQPSLGVTLWRNSNVVRVHAAEPVEH